MKRLTARCLSTVASSQSDVKGRQKKIVVAKKKQEAETEHEQSTKSNLTPSDIRKAKRQLELAKKKEALETFLQLFAPTVLELSVYRVSNLHSVKGKRERVKRNMQRIGMSGVIVILPCRNRFSIVIAEGGAEQLNKFHHLMMDINWTEDLVKSTDSLAAGLSEIPNKCDFVWRGKHAKQRCFGFVAVEGICDNVHASNFFENHKCINIWNLTRDYEKAIITHA